MYIITHHVYGFWVNGLCDNSSVLGDILHHLVQGCSLHFLPFEITQGVLHKVKKNSTLPNFLYK